MMKPTSLICLVIALSARCGDAVAEPLPGTQPLVADGDLAARMLAGIDVYLDWRLADAPKHRSLHWSRDLSSPAAYVASVDPNRQRLATILGVVDPREPVRMRFEAPVGDEPSRNSAEVGHGAGFKVFAVRWNVFRGVEAEGLLLVPDGEVKAMVVAVPDCDWTPEQVSGVTPGLPATQQFARRLAENGCRVIVPMLVDRSDTNAGLPGVRKLRQTQREVLWRAAYEMGRTVQGYEVQKVLAAVDWCAGESRSGQRRLPIGVVGYGEGGMIACFAGAIDPRIDVTAVSGYQVTMNLQDEPIYRNVWSFTEEFGRGELCGLIAPRQLVWEDGMYPETTYPRPGQASDGAAPGRLGRPNPTELESVLKHAGQWLEGVPGVSGWGMVQGQPEDVFNDASVAAILDRLKVGPSRVDSLLPVTPSHPAPDAAQRALRQYSQILEDTQWLMRESQFTRAEFWKKADRGNAAAFVTSAKWYRDYLLNEIVGSIPSPSLPPNPRSRQVFETESFAGYEVMLDVHPDVFAYGILLVPKGIKAGEKRPLVICQHGLEG